MHTHIYTCTHTHTHTYTHIHTRIGPVQSGPAALDFGQTPASFPVRLSLSLSLSLSVCVCVCVSVCLSLSVSVCLIRCIYQGTRVCVWFQCMFSSFLLFCRSNIPYSVHA